MKTFRLNPDQPRTIAMLIFRQIAALSVLIWSAGRWAAQFLYRQWTGRAKAGGAAAGAAAQDAPALSYAAAISKAKKALIPIIAVSALINVLMLTGSVYMLQVYDRVLSSGSVPTLIGLFAIVIVLFVFLGVFDFVRARMLSRTSAFIDVQGGSELFERWIKQADTKPATHPPLSDLDSVRSFLTGAGSVALLDLPWSPMYLAILFMLHPFLGWATVAGAAVAGLLALATWRVTARATQDSSSAFEAERAFAAKTHRMSELVRAMGSQDATTRRWRQLRSFGLASQQTGAEPAEALKSASKAVRMLTQSTILTVGAFLVLQGDLTAGLIIASSILSGRALAPVDQLVGSWQSISRAKAAHDRLMLLSDDSDDAKETLKLPTPLGRLTVDAAQYDVSVGGDNHRRILDGLTFDLSPGDALGIVGNSASGKTSLARLLVGVLTPTDGEVRLDGATFDQWGHDRVGRYIGYLPQRVDLLDGTVADNITRLYPDAQDQDIITAAKRAGLHEMILRLPDGYQTRVGGPGTDGVLSGGQVQRLGLARAIFGDPKLVVLDEPNAHLDRDGDQSLTSVIADLRKRKVTVVVIAHRRSALAAVNKLMILKDGKIQSFGLMADFMSKEQKSSNTAAEPAQGAPALNADPNRIKKRLVRERKDVSVVRSGILETGRAVGKS
ncbi:MAG: type I secretion system permease/ATPase [Pseudomonadota bacterium]